jgi:hypothetical protein
MKAAGAISRIILFSVLVVSGGSLVAAGAGGAVVAAVRGEPRRNTYEPGRADQSAPGRPRDQATTTRADQGRRLASNASSFKCAAAVGPGIRQSAGQRAGP